MFKEVLEKRGVHLSNSEFAKVMDMVTDDIKFNRIGFKKCTSLEYVLEIILISASISKRCA